jgi:microcystin degradation protein MlrC
MPTYCVTVEGFIARSYDIVADDKETANEQARERFDSEPDAGLTYGADIIECRLIEADPEPMTKAETYERLKAYIIDITENQEPLDLLERLKP